MVSPCLKIAHQDSVISVSFSADGQYVCSAGMDGKINVSLSVSGQHVITLEGPDEFTVRETNRKRLYPIISISLSHDSGAIGILGGMYYWPVVLMVRCGCGVYPRVKSCTYFLVMPVPSTLVPFLQMVGDF